MAVEVTVKSDQDQIHQEPPIPFVNLADNEVGCRACTLRAGVLDACVWCACGSRDSCSLRPC
eukprot:15124-Pleurochrysis_carterae.AAC.1